MQSEKTKRVICAPFCYFCHDFEQSILSCIVRSLILFLATRIVSVSDWGCVGSSSFRGDMWFIFSKLYANWRSIAEPTPQGIFGVPLQTSIKYANVAISLLDAEGKGYIYGYVPIVVAKCGVFLKEKG